jgi:hypothetical protein
MDPNITKALNDKLYDKRKSGALELEGLIRESLSARDFDRIQRIVSQLCHEYAYAVHQPHARNGGLIGLAAASIALGPVRMGSRLTSTADGGVGSRSLPRGNRPARARLLHRSRCSSPILRVREHVQHRKGGQGRDSRLLQPGLRCSLQGCTVPFLSSHA